MKRKRVMMAMSGGVDSSIAALLLQEAGYDIVGVTLKMFDNKEIGLEGDSSFVNARDAKQLADKMSFPHYVFDFCDSFRADVIGHFIEEYEQGRTPNPCVDCNKNVKLGKLFGKAAEMGCDYIATGHYANVKFDEQTGRWLLLRGEDRQKDQSYMLYTLTQNQLSRILFPLGHMHKTEIRDRAETEGLANARKPDSQDICFVPDGDYARRIENITHRKPKPGKFIHLDGTVLGNHKGQLHYTIGQRKGLGIAYRYPLYVIKKDIDKNIVYLGPEEALFSDTLVAEHCNLISVSELDGPMRVTAKPRYRAKDVPAVIEPAENGNIKVTFDEPQRALTPGQAVVFYQDEVVVGGGTIR